MAQSVGCVFGKIAYALSINVHIKFEIKYVGISNSFSVVDVFVSLSFCVFVVGGGHFEKCHINFGRWSGRYERTLLCLSVSCKASVLEILTFLPIV